MISFKISFKCSKPNCMYQLGVRSRPPDFCSGLTIANLFQNTLWTPWNLPPQCNMHYKTRKILKPKKNLIFGKSIAILTDTPFNQRSLGHAMLDNGQGDSQTHKHTLQPLDWSGLFSLDAMNAQNHSYQYVVHVLISN